MNSNVLWENVKSVKYIFFTFTFYFLPSPCLFTGSVDFISVDKLMLRARFEPAFPIWAPWINVPLIKPLFKAHFLSFSGWYFNLLGTVFYFVMMLHEASSRPRRFSLAKLFTFPLSSSLQKTPPLSLSHPFIRVSNSLLLSQTLLTVIFKLPCLCCFLCIHLLSFVPPACLKAFCSLFMVSLWRRPPPQREKRKGNEKGEAVSFLSLWRVRNIQYLFSVLCGWGIDLLFCFPAVRVQKPLLT